MQQLVTSRLSLVLGLTLIFQWLFWSEGLGLNLLMFSALVTAALLSLHPGALASPRVWATVLGSVITGLMLVIHHSGTALMVHLGAMLLMVGFIQAPALHHVGHALGQSLGSYLRLGMSLRREGRRLAVEIDWLQRLWPYLRLVGLPLLAVGVFLAIFLTANPRLATLSGDLMASMADWLGQVSLAWIGCTALGLLLVAGLVYHQSPRQVLRHEASFTEFLTRQRRKRDLFDFIGLKKEYRSGVLMLAMINALLLLNNLVDIGWIWLGQDLPKGTGLTQFVHEGTYLLILSILLAMGIMLYYFRGNQNFYRQSSLLHRLSYLWIAQNVILVISVAMRNAHYIAHFGLAYKRIGVFFFLLLVLYGLGSLVFKIRDRRSGFFLFRVNGWAVYGLAVMLTLVNWDPFIARYNLGHHEETGFLDRGFLLDLSAQALPILLEHRAVFEQADDGRRDHYRDRLRENVDLFHAKQDGRSWRSWNWADAQVTRSLHGQ
jgi:hypothetical protein